MDKGLIFIACGQLTNQEKTLGLSIQKHIKDKYSINTFLAETAHDLVDLNSHIFKNLNNCTGFIAILHKRNQINIKYDTSVWINQEIAVIAYLKSIGKEVPSLILIEDEAEQEGLIKYTIANPPTFKTDDEALTKIDEWAKHSDFTFKTSPIIEAKIKYVDSAYPQDKGINKMYQELGYEVRWFLDRSANRRIDIEGWEYAYSKEEDGSIAILKMKDRPGDQTLLMKKLPEIDINLVNERAPFGCSSGATPTGYHNVCRSFIFRVRNISNINVCLENVEARNDLLGVSKVDTTNDRLSKLPYNIGANRTEELHVLFVFPNTISFDKANVDFELQVEFSIGNRVIIKRAIGYFSKAYSPDAKLPRKADILTSLD